MPASLIDIRHDAAALQEMRICLRLEDGRDLWIRPIEKRPRRVGDSYVTFWVKRIGCIAFWIKSEHEELKCSSMSQAVELSRHESDRWWLFENGVHREDAGLDAEQVTALLISHREAAHRKADRALQKLQQPSERQEATPSNVANSATISLSGPKPQFIRRWQDAERVALEWMRHLGFADARLTGEGTDSGIDIDAAGAVAQVKALMKGKTGRPAVQQLGGAAGPLKKAGIFFSLSGYTAEATQWACETGIALFEFNAEGRIDAANDAAARLMVRPGAKRLDLPPLPSYCKGIVNGVAAFYGVVVGVLDQGSYVRLILRTLRTLPDVICRPSLDVDWFSDRRLSSWSNLLSPYRTDEKFGSGCSMGLPLERVHAIMRAANAGLLRDLPGEAGWFYVDVHSSHVMFTSASCV